MGLSTGPDIWKHNDIKLAVMGLSSGPDMSCTVFVCFDSLRFGEVRVGRGMVKP